MPEITSNVKFDNIAREWRCKWSDKECLTSVQAKLEELLPEVSSVEGVASIQRVVCGGCLDFKVIVKLPAAAFAEWEKKEFAPEVQYLNAIKSISGVSSVETQTFTLEEVKLNAKALKKAKEAKGKDQDKKTEEDAEEKQLTPEEAEKLRKDTLKKVIKEGGKRGVEIEGAADMGGLQFFCTSVDTPDGDLELLEECMKAMNAEADPTAEERKGCSGHIGKMIFSAGTHQLAVVAYVPKEKQSELSCSEWLGTVLNAFEGKVEKEGAEVSTGVVLTDGDKNIFPLKIREPMILESNNFLRKRSLFPEDKDDSDEMVFGDDDFPS